MSKAIDPRDVCSQETAETRVDSRGGRKERGVPGRKPLLHLNPHLGRSEDKFRASDLTRHCETISRIPPYLAIRGCGRLRMMGIQRRRNDDKNKF